MVKLATERKHLTDIIKMVAYQAESDLLALLRPHYAPDFDALGNVAALLEEPCHASAGCAQLLAEPAMSNLEAPHGRPALFGIVRGGD